MRDAPMAWDLFMAAPDGRKHFIPLAFDVGPVGVERGFQTGPGQDFSHSAM